MTENEGQETAQSGGQEESEAPEGIPFLAVASIFFNQGAMALGAMPHPMTGELFVSYEAIQESIEILETLREKTQGNLTDEEERGLTGMIDELKLAFVQAVRDPRFRELAERSMKAAEQPAAEPSRIVTPEGRPASSADSGPKIILPGSF